MGFGKFSEKYFQNSHFSKKSANRAPKITYKLTNSYLFINLAPVRFILQFASTHIDKFLNKDLSRVDTLDLGPKAWTNTALATLFPFARHTSSPRSPSTSYFFPLSTKIGGLRLVVRWCNRTRLGSMLIPTRWSLFQRLWHGFWNR